MAMDVDNTLHDLIARVGTVRRWLIALGALRTAALGLACVSVYTTLYAWIDHRVHFGHLERLLACTLFVVLLALLTYYLVRALRRDLTYARAAVYIENRENLEQQLIAAVEYYEKRADYPYSEALAGHLVRQVDEATREFDFSSIVDKRRGYLLAGFIFLCLLVVGFFIGENAAYFSSYLARLLRPFSTVEPLAATNLTPTTGDIVTGPNVPLTLTAAVEGRMPESATLILTRPEVQDANRTSDERVERIEASLTTDPQGKTSITATTSFDALEQLQYRFQAGAVLSEPHTIQVCRPPAIENMVARVTPPGKPGAKPLGTYTQPIENQTLQVLPHSAVELAVQTTTPIREATITSPDGKTTVVPLDAGNTFSSQFQAEQDMTVKFDLVGREGLPNSKPLELQVQLKADEPPQFKLLSPEGDYLTTDVASVPIAFEVTDDFGVETMQLCCELPQAEKTILTSASPQGSKEAHLAHTLELENHDLRVGDTILFYAQARDVNTGQEHRDANACSEVYFIEIRPYRQYWHTKEGGGESQNPGPTAEDLTTILEYTRAILKKTWTIAQAPQLTREHRSRFGPLRSDVEYCEKLLTAMRDDPENGFSNRAKSKLTEIGGHYTEAAGCLARQEASEALAATSDAYRLLRKFIDELHLQWNPPQSGQSVPEDKPDRIKLQEEPEAPPMEKERLESRLKKIQQEIDGVRGEQESVKARLKKELEESSRQANAAQPSGESSSGSDANTEPSGRRSGETSAAAKQEASETDQPAGPGDTTGESQDGQGSAQNGSTQTGAGQQSQSSSAGQAAQDSGSSDGQGSQGAGGTGSNGSGSSKEGSSATQGSRPGDGQQASGPGAGSSQGQSATSSNGGSAPGEETASTSRGRPSSTSTGTSGPAGRAGDAAARQEAVLQMLQAKQQALRCQTSEVDAELKRLPLSEYSSHARAKGEAEGHLDRAVEQMKELEDTLGDLRYRPPLSQEQQRAVTDLADSISRRLAEVGRALDRGLSAGDERGQANQAEDIAERLAKDAEAFDESVSPAERQEMLARLEAAKRLLENMAGARWATVSGGGPGAGHVFTRSGRLGPAEQARLLAREFWSLTVQTRDRRIQPPEDESSDIEFFEAEKEFFESAAKFRPQPNEK